MCLSHNIAQEVCPGCLSVSEHRTRFCTFFPKNAGQSKGLVLKLLSTMASWCASPSCMISIRLTSAWPLHGDTAQSHMHCWVATNYYDYWAFTWLQKLESTPYWTTQYLEHVLSIPAATASLQTTEVSPTWNCKAPKFWNRWTSEHHLVSDCLISAAWAMTKV